jgi:YD repeat-containing protein
MVSRDGHTPYRTDYVYHAENVYQDGCQVPGHGADWRRCTYRDYLEPYEIQQHGDFDRTIKREFRHDFGTRYIRAKVTKEKVDDTYAKEATYDGLGFMEFSTVFEVATTYERSSNGNLSKKTDATSRWTEYAHSFGRVSKVRTPLYSVRRLIGSDGTVTWEGRDGPDVTDPPRKTWFTYDRLGRETSRTPPLGLATTTSYSHERDATDPYVEVTRGTSSTRSFLDGYGRTVRMENAAGIKTETGFDVWGRKASESYPYTGPTAIGTSYIYDALDRVTTKTEADGKQTIFGYGSRSDGLTVGITEPFGQGGSRTTVQTWEATGDPNARRLIRVVDAAQLVTEYGYNALDKLTAVVSPGIPARQYYYVAGTDRLEWEAHPESGRTDYGYFANGTLQTRNDALGHTLTYSYDAVNRLQGVSASADANYSVGITYDDPYSDNRATAGNAFVSSAFGYDTAGRLQSRTDTVRATAGAAGRPFTTTYTPNAYDSIGSVTYPAGRTVTYGYNSLQRITSVADGTRSYASDFTYHPSGQVEDYTSGNLVTNQFRYDPLTYRPATITHAGGGQSLLGLTYSYYDEGNVKGITDARSGMGADFSNGYDALDRLMKADGPWGTLAFEYDAVGNRRSKVQNGAATTYTYPANGRNLLGAASGDGQPGESFGYNAVGETESDARGTYAYTPTGLLATATLANGLTVTHRYDADDLRAVQIKGSSKTHYYIHGLGGQLLSEYVEQGGELRWAQDYIYAGSRLLAAVRPGIPAIPVTLTVTRTGSGTVTGQPGGISCGETCSATYPQPTTVTLVATPADGWWFGGWSGGCSGTTPQIDVPVNTDLTCTATFTDGPNLTVQTVGTGSGRVMMPGASDCRGACTVTYPQGTIVGLRAVPDAGSLVVGWSGACSGSGMGANVTMTDNKTCTATFGPAPPFPKLAPASGTALQGNALLLSWSAVENATSYWYCVAPTQTLTCDTGWVWTDTRTTALVSGLAPGPYYWQAKVQTLAGRFDADGGTWRTFTVPANLRTLTMTVVNTGGGTGHVTMPDGFDCRGVCAPGYVQGATVMLRAVPDARSLVVGWSGDCAGTGMAMSVTMTDTRSCTATFGPAPPFPKVAPADGATVVGSAVSLAWTAVPDLQSTWYCVAQTPTITCDTMWIWTGTTPSAVVTGLAPGLYYWQTKAQTTAGRFDGDDGTWWTFTVPVPPPPADHWKAEYFSNATLSGTPTSTVDEGTGFIDHAWGVGGPSGLPVDNFSARYTRTVTFPAGRHRFAVVTDDGSRLWVDDQLRIDRWDDQPPATFTVDVDLTAGAHTVRYEYYEHVLGATAHLSWDLAPTTIPADHWKAEYFSNADLSSPPTSTADEGTGIIDHWWDQSGPTGLPVDYFSALHADGDLRPRPVPVHHLHRRREPVVHRRPAAGRWVEPPDLAVRGGDRADRGAARLEVRAPRAHGGGVGAPGLGRGGAEPDGARGGAPAGGQRPVRGGGGRRRRCRQREPVGAGALGDVHAGGSERGDGAGRRPGGVADECGLLPAGGVGRGRGDAGVGAGGRGVGDVHDCECGPTRRADWQRDGDCAAEQRGVLRLCGERRRGGGEREPVERRRLGDVCTSGGRQSGAGGSARREPEPFGRGAVGGGGRGAHIGCNSLHGRAVLAWRSLEPAAARDRDRRVLSRRCAGLGAGGDGRRWAGAAAPRLPAVRRGVAAADAAGRPAAVHGEGARRRERARLLRGAVLSGGFGAVYDSRSGSTECFAPSEPAASQPVRLRCRQPPHIRRPRWPRRHRGELQPEGWRLWSSGSGRRSIEWLGDVLRLWSGQTGSGTRAARCGEHNSVGDALDIRQPRFANVRIA